MPHSLWSCSCRALKELALTKHALSQQAGTSSTSQRRPANQACRQKCFQCPCKLALCSVSPLSPLHSTSSRTDLPRGFPFHPLHRFVDFSQLLAIAQILHAVNPDQPVLRGVGLLHMRQLKVLVANLHASCTIKACWRPEVQLKQTGQVSGRSMVTSFQHSNIQDRFQAGAR